MASLPWITEITDPISTDTEPLPDITEIPDPPVPFVSTFIVSSSIESSNTQLLRPLTRPYLQPSDCSTQWWVVSSLSTTAVSSGMEVEGQTGALSQYCYPSTGVQAYSPGMCFNGAMPTLIVERSKQVSWQALCCPTGMVPDSSFRQCEGSFSTAFTAIVSPVTLTAAMVKETSETIVLTITSDTTTVLSSGLLLAEPITVYWQSKDLSLFPTAYASSLARAIGVSMPTESPAPTEPPASRPSDTILPKSGAYSTGVKAGITVGAILGAVLVVGIATLFLLRRHRKRPKPHDNHAIELSGQSSGFRKFIAGKWRAEAEAIPGPVELDSKRVTVVPGPPVELEGSHEFQRGGTDRRTSGS